MKLPVYVAKMLEEVVKNEGFIKYEIEMTSASNHSDGIHGQLQSIELSGNRLNDSGNIVPVKLHLMCKMQPLSKERRDCNQSGFLFKREIYIYTRVLPRFAKFQEEKGLAAAENFSTYPKVYATHVDDENENYAFIMDDLRTDNFVMWPRNDAVPFDHVKMILQQLARFHAVSFALKDQQPNAFAEFKNIYDVLEMQVVNGNFGEFMSSGHREVLGLIIDDEHKKIMQRLTNNYFEIMKNLYSIDANDAFGVVNHGDCWINNFVFRYNDNNAQELENVSFLDWQISRYGSPAFDVLGFIFVSTSKDFRDQHYDEMINIYYDESREMIKRLGSDPDKLFTFADLQNELKRCAPFVLCMTTVFKLVALAHENDFTKMDEYYTKLANGEKSNWLRPDEIRNDFIRTKEINGIISDIIAHGYDH